MGNICCGGDQEEYKHGAWHDPNDDDNSNNDDDDDGQYNAEATNREQLILLHEQTRRISAKNKETEEKNCSAVDENGGPKNNGMTRLKRPSITSTPIDMSSSFTFSPPSFPKSPETTEFLLSTLSHNFVFASIGEDTKLQFINAMQSQEFNEGDWVMHQGDVGDYFYIVEEGEVAFHVGEGSPTGNASENSPQVGAGLKGSSFGELALLYNTPRAASIRALTPLKLYKIDQLTFRSLLMSHQLQDRSNIISLVGKMSVFQDLDEAKLRKLVDAFTIVEFNEGERIVNKGDHGDIFYIVKSGTVKIDDIGHGSSKFKDQLLGKGDCFGERALITGETRAANVTAVEKSSFLVMSKRVLENIIGPLEQAIMNSSHSKYLRSIPFFEGMEQDEIDRCVVHLKEEIFEKGDKIMGIGKLYLIQEGHALMMLQEKGKVSGDGENENDGAPKKKISYTMPGPKLVKLEKGDYFGDLWGSSEQAKNRVVNVEESMKCLTLLDSVIQHVIGCTEGLKSDAEKDSRWIRMTSKSSSFDRVKSKRTVTNRDVLSLSKLKKHRILGVGTFGKVWLVTPKSNTKDKPTPYALKMVSKRQLLQQKLTVTVLREKNVMESIDHPLLMKMVSSFQDENYLYFVMDLILGGELFELLYSNGKANTDNAAWKESVFYKSFGHEKEKPIKGLAGIGVRKALFYGACVIDAFAYLHNRRIVYRDLKPENILLDEKGYCIVVDFGFAKVVLDKTYTMCGTPEYLAPEVIVNKGHNHAADYWSFACLLYELMVGQTPFFQAGLDQMSLLKKIVRAQYTFPGKTAKLNPDSSNVLDKTLCHWKDLISRLLTPKAMERIGNLRNGIEDILDHDWFANVDFAEFRKQSIPAPWVPTIVDPLDTSHFGNNFGQEEKKEIFMNKLSAKDQEVFRAF